jgi:ribosomal protein S18 acetylase RimI-like enzyme
VSSIVVRAATADDLDALWVFLAIAAYEPDVTAAKNAPGVAAYLRGWLRPGDFGFLAERDAEIVGAAWARQFAVDEGKFVYGSPQTPKVTIGVLPGLRGQGIGQKLLRSLIAEAEGRGLGLCLGVRTVNPARHLYERLGFRVVPGSEYPNKVGGSSVGMLLGAPAIGRR